MALKFVIYDTATGRSTQPASGDSITLPGNITASEVLSANQAFAGALRVTGELDAQGSFALENRFAHINSGKINNTAETAGFVFQINGSASGFTVLDIADTGVLTMDSDPTGTFTAGDIVQLRGSAEFGNNGLYEVDSVTTGPDEVVLAAVPTDEFIRSGTGLTNDGLGGSLQKVTLAVMRYSSAGALQTATGGTAGFSFSAVGGGGGVSDLQGAYDGGASIITDGAGGALAISGDQAITMTSTNFSGIEISTSGVMAGNIVLDSEAGITLQTTGLFTGSGINLNTSSNNSPINLSPGSGDISVSGSGNTLFTNTDFSLNIQGDFTANPDGSTLLSCGAITTETVRGAFEAIARNSTEIDDVGVPVHAVNNSGTVNFAASDASALSTAKVVGLSLSSQTTAGFVFDAVCLVGSIAQVRFDVAPAASSIGSYVYLSETKGRATLTPPSAAGSVVCELGILVTANGSSVVPKILFNPRFVIEN